MTKILTLLFLIFLTQTAFSSISHFSSSLSKMSLCSLSKFEAEENFIEIRMRIFDSSGKLIPTARQKKINIYGASNTNFNYFETPAKSEYKNGYLTLLFIDPVKGRKWEKLILVNKSDTMQLHFYGTLQRVIVDSIPFQEGCFSMDYRKYVQIEDKNWEDCSVENWNDVEIDCRTQVELTPPKLTFEEKTFFVGDTILIRLNKARAYVCNNIWQYQIIRWNEASWQPYIKTETETTNDALRNDCWLQMLPVMNHIYKIVLPEKGKYKFIIKINQIVSCTGLHDSSYSYGRCIKYHEYLYSEEFEVL